MNVGMKNPTFFHNKEILTMTATQAEPETCQKALKRALNVIKVGRDTPIIIDDKVNSNEDLTNDQKLKLRQLHSNYEELFDGSLGGWKISPVSVDLKKDAKPYHSRPYPVQYIYKEQFKKELESLEKVGVIKKDSSSQWAAPAFTIPKKDGSLRFLTDFHQLNKRMIRKPYPLPKISEVLQELEGLNYATLLDLKMEYYTLGLDPDTQSVCTIITPWGKYKYLRLPMGVMSAPDIFQKKMSDLRAHLNYVKIYIDGLLIITKNSLEDPFAKLKRVLTTL